MKKEFWIWLTPDTFIWKNNEETLVYNSRKGNGFTIPLSKALLSMVERLLDPVQMYCTGVTSTEMSDKLVRMFVDKVVTTGSGRIVEKEEGKPKPIVMFPKLNIQRSVERQNKISDNFRDDKIMLDLFEMTIYFSGIQDKSKDGWHKQFKYPPVTEAILDGQVLLKHLRILSGSNGLKSINLIASSFSGIDSFVEIIDILCRLNVSKTVWCRLEDFKGDMVENVRILSDGGFQLMFIIDPICDVEKAWLRLDSLLREFPEEGYMFIITSEADYDSVACIIDRLDKPFEPIIVPYFTGDNSDFFLKHVFIKHESMLISGLTKREVFANQAVNSFDFGKVSLMPDGKFYANLNQPPIGGIGENMKEVLHRELFTGHSWRRIRDSSPCTECLYRWLCPSPSNYDLVIGRMDLCTKSESGKRV